MCQRNAARNLRACENDECEECAAPIIVRENIIRKLRVSRWYSTAASKYITLDKTQTTANLHEFEVCVFSEFLLVCSSQWNVTLTHLVKSTQNTPTKNLLENYYYWTIIRAGYESLLQGELKY